MGRKRSTFIVIELTVRRAERKANKRIHRLCCSLLQQLWNPTRYGRRDGVFSCAAWRLDLCTLPISSASYIARARVTRVPFLQESD